MNPLHKKLAGGAFVVLAIAALVFFFFIQGNDETQQDKNRVTYNGFEFIKADGLWNTQWQRDGQIYLLEFRFNPFEVENVPVSGRTDTRFQMEQVHITIDPQEERSAEDAYAAVAAIELARKLVDPFDRDVIAACTRNETEACAQRPIITCENTNSTVMYLKHAPESKIELQGNCAIFYGDKDGLVKAVDKALYTWLGIMQ